MIAAIVAAVLVMMVFAQAVGDFVHRHPTIKMLALAFLLLIGVMLIADGTGHHVPKGYIYAAMAFSLFVEMLNMRAGLRHKAPAPETLAPETLAPETLAPGPACGRGASLRRARALERRSGSCGRGRGPLARPPRGAVVLRYAAVALGEIRGPFLG